MSDDSRDLLRALAQAVERGDPWRIPQDHCPACEGRGWLEAYSFRGRTTATCWDCGGTGEGDPTQDKDISHDD